RRSSTVVIVSAERRVLVVSSGYLMARIQIFEQDRPVRVIVSLHALCDTQRYSSAQRCRCKTVGVSQEATSQTGKTTRSQCQGIQWRLIEDVIESIAVSISNVSTAGRRIRQCVAAKIHEVCSSISRTRVGKAQDLAKHRARILSDSRWRSS